jgi:hypothetical protein
VFQRGTEILTGFSNNRRDLPSKEAISPDVVSVNGFFLSNFTSVIPILLAGGGSRLIGRRKSDSFPFKSNGFRVRSRDGARNERSLCHAANGGMATAAKTANAIRSFREMVGDPHFNDEMRRAIRALIRPLA